MKSVLVTGGLGYIGSLVVKMLKEKEYEVTIIDNNLYDLQANNNFIRDDAYNIHRHYDEEYDAVIALAGIVGDEACLIDTRRTEYYNYHTTMKLADLNCKRMIFASTCSVYGRTKEIVNENSKVEPISLYGKTKQRSEKLISESTTIDTKVILRLPTIFGYSMRPRFDLVVNLFIAKAYFDRKIQVFGGEQIRPFCHVRDIARCFVDLVDAPHDDINDQIFNVGGLNYSILKLAEIIKLSIPRTEVEVLKDQDDPRNYEVDFTKIKEILGFKPAYDLSFAISEFEKAFKNKTVGHYSSTIYNNYKRLKELDLGIL